MTHACIKQTFAFLTGVQDIVFLFVGTHVWLQRGVRPQFFVTDRVIYKKHSSQAARREDTRCLRGLEPVYSLYHLDVPLVLHGAPLAAPTCKVQLERTL